jgi:hypothetical protein
LRDTILIVIAIIGAASAIIGVSLYFALRRTLESTIIKSAERRISRECRKIRAQSDIQAGVIDWLGGRLLHAIKKTKRGLKDGGDVLEEENIIWGKSNLGYYYAESHKQKPSWHLKKESIDLTKVGYDRYNPEESYYNNPDWIDNYIYVKVAFANTPQEKAELTELINNLLSRTDLQAIHQYLAEYLKELAESPLLL